MAILSRKHNLLYIQTPRTASTAIAECLIQYFCGEKIPEEALLDENGHYLLHGKHATLSDLLGFNILTDKDADELFKFTSIRNPFDSIVTLWAKSKYTYPKLLKNKPVMYRNKNILKQTKDAQTMSFDEWVYEQFGHLEKLDFTKRFINDIDAVIKFENLQVDFDNILIKLGLPTKTIPKVHETANRDPLYQKYYSMSTKKLIEKLCKEELDRNGYIF